MTTVLSIGKDFGDILDEALSIVGSVGDIGTSIVSAVTGQPAG